MRMLIGLTFWLLVAAEACADGAPPVQVMVLGTYHMDNPGLDLHNARADDVLTSQRQAELAAVAEALAAFKPTVIAIERVTPAPAYEDAALASMMSRTGTLIADFERRQASSTVAELLIDANDPRTLADPSMYYEMLAFDAGEDQPGAELLGYWFMRNAKIFAKLIDVVKPGDRVVVLFGGGHKHWLEHLARNTPGFEVVDPVPCLRR